MTLKKVLVNIDFRNVMLSFPSSESRKRIAIWVSNTPLVTTIFFLEFS